MMFLLIDDSAIDRVIGRKVLEWHFSDQHIEEVSSGEEGISWLKNRSLKINEKIIILLDIRMPEMNGFEFLDVFVTLPDPIKSKSDIFMLSSSLDPNDIDEAERHMDVKKLLEKPLNPEKLEKLLK